MNDRRILQRRKTESESNGPPDSGKILNILLNYDFVLLLTEETIKGPKELNVVNWCKLIQCETLKDMKAIAL